MRTKALPLRKHPKHGDLPLRKEPEKNGKNCKEQFQKKDAIQTGTASSWGGYKKLPRWKRKEEVPKRMKKTDLQKNCAASFLFSDPLYGDRHRTGVTAGSYPSLKGEAKLKGGSRTWRKHWQGNDAETAKKKTPIVL